MTIGCNIWMICLILIWFFYSLSRMFQLPQFVCALRSSVWDVFINCLLIDATDRSKISSDQKRFFIALSLYPLSFFANTPCKYCYNVVFQFHFFLVTTVIQVYFKISHELVCTGIVQCTHDQFYSFNGSQLKFWKNQQKRDEVITQLVTLME